MRGVRSSPPGIWLVLAALASALCPQSSLADDLLLTFGTRDNRSMVSCVTFSPDGRTLASGDCGGTIRLWNTSTGALLQTTSGHNSCVGSIAFSPDGRMFAAGHGYLRVWDTSMATLLPGVPKHKGCYLAFSPDGSMLAASSDKGTVELWDTSTWALLRRLSNPTTASIDWVAFSLDGRTLGCASGWNNKVNLWDTSTWALRRTLSVPQDYTDEFVLCVTFSPDGTTLAAACSHGTVKLLDAFAGSLLVTLAAYTGSMPWGQVHSVAFSPDGRILASGANDVKLWDTSTWMLTCALPCAATSVAFSPDGRTLASGSWDDNAIRLWKAPAATSSVGSTACPDVRLQVQLGPADPMIGEEVSLHPVVSGWAKYDVEWRLGFVTNDVREATQVFYAPGSQPGLLVVTAKNGCEAEQRFTINVSAGIANLWRDPNTLLRLVQHQEHRKTPEEILSYDTWNASRMDAILQRLYEDQAAIDEEQGGILGQIAMSITGALQGVTEALEEKIGWAIDFVSGAQDVVVGFSSDVVQTAKKTLKQGMLADLAAARGRALTTEEKTEVGDLFDATIGEMTDRLSTDVEDKIDEKFDELKARLELLRPSGQSSALTSTLSANIPSYVAAFKGALLYGKMGLLGALKQVGVSMGRDLGQAGFKGIIGKLAPMFFAMSINDISGVGDLSQQMNAARSRLAEAWRQYSAVRINTNQDLYTYKHILALPELWQPIMEVERMMIRAYDSLPELYQTEAVRVKRDKWELRASTAEGYIAQYLTIDSWLNGECGQVFLATYGRPELVGEVTMPLAWTSFHVETAIRWLVGQW